MIRRTKQHDTVRQNLKSRHDHPTAEMVYGSVRQTIPDISLATVYRNLRNMADEDEIISFTQSGKEHFDAVNVPHMHVCCKICGKIEDVFFPDEDSGLEFNDGFRVDNVIVQGICSDCRKNMQ